MFNYKNYSYSLFVGVNNYEIRGFKELLLINLLGNLNILLRVVLIKLFIINILDLKVMLFNIEYLIKS